MAWTGDKPTTGKPRPDGAGEVEVLRAALRAIRRQGRVGLVDEIAAVALGEEESERAQEEIAREMRRGR